MSLYFSTTKSVLIPSYGISVSHGSVQSQESIQFCCSNPNKSSLGHEWTSDTPTSVQEYQLRGLRWGNFLFNSCSTHLGSPHNSGTVGSIQTSDHTLGSTQSWSKKLNFIWIPFVSTSQYLCTRSQTPPSGVAINSHAQYVTELTWGQSVKRFSLIQFGTTSQITDPSFPSVVVSIGTSVVLWVVLIVVGGLVGVGISIPQGFSHSEI